LTDLQLLPGIWTPVKGYDRLLARLRALGYHESTDDPDDSPGNLLPVGYDWRLSCRYTGRWLGTVVEPALERWRAQGGRYAEARLVFVCHSMGGLVARWYIERCGGAEITSKLVTLGTPYRGGARALEQLVNGVHKGLGPLAADLTRFARSLPSLHQLLPEYACIEKGTDLARTTEIVIPELSAAKIADAMYFHAELRAAEESRPDGRTATHAIIGTGQPTATTARLADDRVVSIDTYYGDDLAGDSVVPLVGACRSDVPMDSNTLRRVPDKHGNLHRNRAALAELEGMLTAKPVALRDTGGIPLRVDVPELVLAGRPMPVRVTLPEDKRQALRVVVTDEGGRLVDARVLRSSRGTAATTIDKLRPGVYTIDVTGPDSASPVSPVSSTVLVWG
jgi:pimeloyl-ACP methyl ester carboxylesterase